MGRILKNKWSEMASCTCWLELLALAQAYGWQPMGPQPDEAETRNPDTENSSSCGKARTRKPEKPEGLKAYRSGVTIRIEDGLALQAALKKALADIPVTHAFDHFFVKREGLKQWLASGIDKDPDAHRLRCLVPFMTPQAVKELKEVIETLEGGPCRIW